MVWRQARARLQELLTAKPHEIEPSYGSGVPSEIVVVPTYNEREMLPLFLEQFARAGGECLIVDDSSPDGTGELADDLAQDRPWLHVLHRPHKGGLGAAYRAGFAWALERGYDGSARWTATSHTLRERSRRCGRRPTAAPASCWGHATWPVAERAAGRSGVASSRGSGA